MACAVVVGVEAVKFVKLLTVVLIALLAFVGAKGIDGRTERIVGIYQLCLARLLNHLANVAPDNNKAFHPVERHEALIWRIV